MGSEVNPTKRRFDLSMSKRTRKPLNHLIKLTTTHQSLSFIATSSPDNHKNLPNQDQDHDHDRASPDQHEQEQDQEDVDRKSLNQLMRREGDLESSDGDQSGSARNNNNKMSSLGQHFSEEEKQMQLAVKKKNDKRVGENGFKFKGMMGRYVKVLSNMIKAKHDGRRFTAHPNKNPILRLKS